MMDPTQKLTTAAEAKVQTGAVTDSMSDSSVVRKPALRSLVPVSDETIRRWEAEGKFPRRLQLGPRCVGWRLGEIRKWIAERSNVVAA